MDETKDERAGQFPGKMPDGIKLADCAEELRSIFKMMPITQRDRDTPAFAGFSGIAASKPFHNPSDREPWAADSYLGDAARDAIVTAMVGGSLPTWLYYDGQFVELDHEVMFGRNRWRSAATVTSGRYLAENVDHYTDRALRRKCDGRTLWVKSYHWHLIRGELISSRERLFGSVLDASYQTLLAGPLAVGGQAWSLYEAVAWILTGNAEFVAQQSRRYAGHSDPKIAGRVTWIRMDEDAKARTPTDQTVSAAHASETLRAACEAGQVKATGRSGADQLPLNNERQVIPRQSFKNAELWPGQGGSLYPFVNGEGKPASWFSLQFDAQSVRHLTELNASDGSGCPASAPPPLPKRRGRKAIYDWAGAMGALMELDGRNDLLARIVDGNATQAEAERYVATWFEQRGASPSEGVIRERVAGVVNHRREDTAVKAGNSGT